MELSEKIKLCRAQKGMTQSDLANQLNVSRKTISNWENNRSFPDISVLVKLSDLFNISLDDLLRNENLINNYIAQEKIAKTNTKFLQISYWLNCILLIICCINLFTTFHIRFVAVILIVNIFVLVTHVSNLKKIFTENKRKISLTIFFMIILLLELLFKRSFENYYQVGYLMGSMVIILFMSISFMLILLLARKYKDPEN